MSFCCEKNRFCPCESNKVQLVAQYTVQQGTDESTFIVPDAPVLNAADCDCDCDDCTSNSSESTVSCSSGTCTSVDPDLIYQYTFTFDITANCETTELIECANINFQRLPRTLCKKRRCAPKVISEAGPIVPFITLLATQLAATERACPQLHCNGSRRTDCEIVRPAALSFESVEERHPVCRSSECKCDREVVFVRQIKSVYTLLTKEKLNLCGIEATAVNCAGNTIACAKLQQLLLA